MTWIMQADHEHQEDNEDLIQSVLDGEEGFSVIYDLFVDRIYKYFLSRVHDTATAEDLTSTLFFSVLSNLPKYRHMGRFQAWIFTIARNIFYKHLREVKQIDFEEIESQYSDSTNLENYVSDRELLHLLSAHIKTLKDDEQELLRLRFIANLKFSDIGQVIGKSESATKKAFYRLIERIKSYLEMNS